MIRAQYKDGRRYEARNVDELDFRQFVIDDLVELEVHGWRWCQFSHGKLCFHGLRTCMTVANVITLRVYCLVTDTWKIFFARTGEVTALRHWIKGHSLFDEMTPPKKKQ